MRTLTVLLLTIIGVFYCCHYINASILPIYPHGTYVVTYPVVNPGVVVVVKPEEEKNQNGPGDNGGEAGVGDGGGEGGAGGNGEGAGRSDGGEQVAEGSGDEEGAEEGGDKEGAEGGDGSEAENTARGGRGGYDGARGTKAGSNQAGKEAHDGAGSGTGVVPVPNSPVPIVVNDLINHIV